MCRIIRDSIVTLINVIVNKKFFEIKRELLETESYSRGMYNEYINKKISILTDYIYEHFGEIFISDPNDNKPNKLSNIKITDKKFYINNVSIFKDVDIKKSSRSTSGSTGEPFRFIKDNLSTNYMNAMMYNVYSWHDISLGDKQARLWGRSLDKRQSFVQLIKDTLLFRLRLSAFEINAFACLDFYNKLVRFKPKYFYAYSNALYQFALIVERLKLDGKKITVPTAICTGEVLFDFQRDKISSIFGCKVVNEYGSTENGIIAFECEHGNMHVLPTVHVEILNPDLDGFGKVLITELNSRVLPFIRYNIGDIARIIYTECKCGRPYDVIEIKEGRIDDYIICPDGKFVYDAVLAYAFKDCVDKFKAVQERVDEIKISIIPNNKYLAMKDDVLVKLKGILGPEIIISITEVDSIAIDKSGKNRYFTSLVKSSKCAMRGYE